MGSLKEGRKSLIFVSEGYTNIIPPQMRNADAQMPGLGNPQAGNPFAGRERSDRRPRHLAGGPRHGLGPARDLRHRQPQQRRRSTPSIRAGCPGSSSTSTRTSRFQTDSKYLTSTMDTLRTLAENTDGRAIVNRNDIADGMKQITQDTSAYYLIGYNSTQAPTDGKFHEIKVRVKRPGVQVRARKGYWALNREEVARATAPAKPATPKPVEAAITNAVVRPSRRAWCVRGLVCRAARTARPGSRSSGSRCRRRQAIARGAARVSLMAIAPDGSPSFRGKVPDAALASATPSAGGDRRRAITGRRASASSAARQAAAADFGGRHRVAGARQRDARDHIPDLMAAPPCSAPRRCFAPAPSASSSNCVPTRRRADAGARIQPDRASAGARSGLRSRGHRRRRSAYTC